MNRDTSFNLKPIDPGSIALWIFSLSILSVGTRNFEQGITLDGPFYATIARNIAKSGDWFTLNPSIPDLNPFYGNPHLGFWVFALWLKVFPAADWALRAVNHIYYVLFLNCLFFYVRRRSGTLCATMTITLLWSWFLFSNTHSNIYLDPGALFWGSLALFLIDNRPSILLAGLAGLALGLCALYKSMTFVGFLPAIVLVSILNKNVPRLGAMLAVFLATLGIYWAAVKTSAEPEFLTRYWSMQITHRFAKIWSLSLLFAPEYWKQLLYYSYYLAPLSLLALKVNFRQALLPSTLAGSFIMIFSLSGLRGGQYLVMVLPWIAWMVSQGLVPWVRFSHGAIIRSTSIASLGLVCVLQYIPYRTHAKGPTPEQIEIGLLNKEQIVSHLYLDLPATPAPFVLAAPFAWYGNVSVTYPNKGTVPEPAAQWGFFLHYRDLAREAALYQKGWCRYRGRFEEGSLWLACDSTVFKAPGS